MPVGMGSNVLPGASNPRVSLPGCSSNPEVRARPPRPIIDPGPAPAPQSPATTPVQVTTGLMPLAIPPKPDYSVYTHQQIIDARMEFVNKFNQLRVNYVPNLISPPIDASLDAIYNTYVDNVKFVLVKLKCNEWKFYIRMALVLIEKGACYSIIDIEGFSKHHEVLFQNIDPIMAEFAHQFMFSGTGMWAPHYRLMFNFAISVGLYWVAKYVSKTIGGSTDSIYPGIVSQWNNVTSSVPTPTPGGQVPMLQGLDMPGLLGNLLNGGGIGNILNMFTGGQQRQNVPAGQPQAQAQRPIYD